MAFTIRQGLEAVDAVMTTFDPAPVVLYESTIGTLYQFRYIVRIQERSIGGTWETISTIYRYPNSESVGTFDIAPVLRNAFEYTEVGNIDVGDALATTDAGTAQPFRIRVGYESAATDGGAVTTTWDSYQYIWAIHARHLDEHTSWVDRPMTDYVLNSSDAKWLTSRDLGKSITLASTNFASPYRVDINDDQRFTMSCLSTDAGSGDFATNPMHLRVRVYDNSDTLQENSTIAITNQSVGIGAFDGFESTGYVTREVHFGPKDLIDSTWHDMDSATRWKYIVAQFEQTSGSVPVSRAVVLTKRDCNVQAVRFKFLNRFGGYDTLQTQGHGAQNTQYTRQTYATNTGNWHTATGLGVGDDLELNSTTKRQVKSFVSKESRKLQARTGYISSEENNLVHDMMRSPMVYATRFDKPRERVGDRFLPVHITGTSLKAMFAETDKLIQYTIDYEHSNPPRTQH